MACQPSCGSMAGWAVARWAPACRSTAGRRPGPPHRHAHRLPSSLWRANGESSNLVWSSKHFHQENQWTVEVCRICNVIHAENQLTTYRYTAEINMPDGLSLYSQLDVNPPQETWAMPTADCQLLFDLNTGHINKNLIPTQKKIERR